MSMRWMWTLSDAKDVDPSSGNMMDAGNLSSFEAPGEQEPVSGTMVVSSTLFEAPGEQEPVSGTMVASSMLFEAPGAHEPVSGTMVASSQHLVNVSRSQAPWLHRVRLT
jgi:hypothetical protein